LGIVDAERDVEGISVRIEGMVFLSLDLLRDEDYCGFLILLAIWRYVEVVEILGK